MSGLSEVAGEVRLTRSELSYLMAEGNAAASADFVALAAVLGLHLVSADNSGWAAAVESMVARDLVEWEHNGAVRFNTGVALALVGLRKVDICVRLEDASDPMHTFRLIANDVAISILAPWAQGVYEFSIFGSWADAYRAIGDVLVNPRSEWSVTIELVNGAPVESPVSIVEAGESLAIRMQRLLSQGQAPAGESTQRDDFTAKP